MNVGQAKAAARRWVLEEGVKLPGFRGAFYHGSTNWLPDDVPLSPASDVDVMVVLADPNPPIKPGKFVYQGVLLEVSYLASDEVRSPEQVLGQAHLAGSFRAPGVIDDPSGRLTLLQAAVAKDYAKRRWVRARCEHTLGKIRGILRSLGEPAPLHDEVTAWLFATGITTHVLLVAGLRNPTVRRRYVAARELLAEYGHAAFYESLLELLGCAGMSRERAEQHLTALAEVFDAAVAVVETPFPFASDLSEHARPIAIDGSRDLIERGDHREAVFWMLATYSRCRKVLYRDAPEEMLDRFDPAYWALLGDLGIASSADLRRRGDEVERFLPRLWEVAGAIMAANRGIEE